VPQADRTQSQRRWLRRGSRAGELSYGGLLFALAALVPLMVTDPTLLDLFITIAYFLLLAGSWNLLAGFAGQFSFAHVALALLGAYAAIFGTDTLGIPVWATLPFAGVATGLVGALLGTVCLRVRGVYLSLVTYAFSGAFVAWAAAADSVTGASRGKLAEVFFDAGGLVSYAWLGLGLVTLFFVSQRLLLNARWGVKAMAVRDREEVAYGLGVDTRRTKVQAFAFSAFWAGVAGSLYAGYIGVIDTTIGSFTNMGLVVAMVVVGGLGRRTGAIFGVVLLQVIAHEVRSFGAEYTMLIFALLVLLVMLFARDGVVGLAERLARRVAARRRRSTPAIVATDSPGGG
jgi:branched-chain amino acid transport system permease protein